MSDTTPAPHAYFEPHQPCHPAALPEEQLLADCQVRRQRRGGPGGQHRNKVETAIVLEHLPTGLRAEASERRSQEQNRSQALFRLRLLLALKVRRQTGPSPSPLWQHRLRQSPAGRLAINPEHPDFPALLAEVLDVLTAEQHDPSTAAQRLQLSSSQLIGLLRKAPAALAQLNQERSRQGRPPLR